MALVKIGNGTPAPANVVDSTRRNGVAFGREDGEWCIGHNFDGIAQVVMDQGNHQAFIATLIEVAGLPSGESPAEVFARTVTVDSEGNITGRFSDKPRARSITIPRSEIQSFIDLMIERDHSWSHYIKLAGG